MTATDYGYAHGDETGVDSAILQEAQKLLAANATPGARVLDFGCGNGYFSARLAAAGFVVTGVDASASGIEQATRHHAGPKFARVDAQDERAVHALGVFDAVVSIEVIEHVPSTQAFVRSIKGCLRPGGVAIVSTPYHGYLKNIAIAAAGLHDRHYNPLWEGGHIKFFSPRTLALAFGAQGFELLVCKRLGRIWPLAKSIVAAFRLSA